MEATPHTALARGRPARSGADHPAVVHDVPGVHPFDTVEWEMRDARIGHGDKVAFEQDGRRVPEVVVAERDEHRRPEVLPRPARLADARALGQADDRAASPARSPTGAVSAATSPRRRTATPSRPS